MIFLLTFILAVWRLEKLDNTHFFDEELEEVEFEKLEKLLPEKEVEFLRNVYDEGWDEPRTKIKLAQIVENTQELIDKRYLQ